MSPADETSQELSLSGEGYRLNVWFRESWGQVMEQLHSRVDSLVPMELWRTKVSGATMPREVNTVLLKYPDEATMYDSYAVALITCPPAGVATVTAWARQTDGLAQNSFVVPMRPEWTCYGSEPFPPFVGEDHSFRTKDGGVFLWQTIPEFTAWATRKGYANQH